MIGSSVPPNEPKPESPMLIQASLEPTRSRSTVLVLRDWKLRTFECTRPERSERTSRV